MKVNVERLPGGQAVLEVDVDADAVGEAIQKAFGKLVKTANVPGFRRGKAPRSLFERYVGKQALYDEAVEQLAPVSYVSAIDQAELEPLEKPELDILEFGEGQGLKYRATVLVKPEAKVNDYRSIAVPIEPAVVDEEAVQKFVAGLLESQAVLEPAAADAELGPGMLATVRMRKVDGQGLMEPEHEQHTLDLAWTDILEGVQAQLAGARAGETRVVGDQLTGGEGAGDPEVSKSPGQWAITVVSLKHKRLPEFNDEFVKTVSQEETVAGLLDSLRERSRRLGEDRAKRSQLEQIFRGLLAQTEVDIPEVMVENRLEGMMRDYEAALEAQGTNLERHLSFTGRSVASLTQELRLKARQDIQLDLALEAVARAEDLQASGEDIEQVARRSGPSQGGRSWGDAGRRVRLRNAVLRSKALQFLSRMAEENAARVQAATTANEEEDAN